MASKAVPIRQSLPASGMLPSVRSTSPLWLWPSLRQAAALLRVDPGTLSRRRVCTERYGQERRLAPTLVLELGDRYYRRREIGELAAALVEHARTQAHDLDELERLEADIERYLAFGRASRRSEPDDAWLAEARRRLPAALYEQVLLAAAPGAKPVESFRGVHFDKDEEG